MRTFNFRVLCTGAVALCLMAGTASAQAKGRGNDKVPPGLAKKGGVPPGQAKKHYRPDEGVVVLRDVFGKHGYTIVRTASNGETRYVYYRLKDGTVRRAIVSPGTEQLAFRNVPAALLTEILARLY